MEKIKVFIVCPWYDPYRMPLLNKLSQEFDVTVVYTMIKEKGREWQLPKNIFINSIFLKPLLLWKVKIKKMFGEELSIYYPDGLLQALIDIKPDVVIGLEFRLSSIIACFWAHINGRGYITWSDMTTYYDMRMGLFRTLNRKMLLYFSNALIGSSSDTLTHFVNDFNYKKNKSFLSILSAHVDKRVTDSIGYAVMGKKGYTKIRFLYVGEILQRKGVHLLIQAFAKLLVSSPESLLTLVGKGNDMKIMKELAIELGCNDSVVFAGSIPYDSVPNEMTCHDIFVFPTLIDAFGLVVAEAAACGLPVICSRYAGAANDLVKDNGLIINPENIDELALAMKTLSCDLELRKNMADAGRLLVKKNDMQTAVKGYGDAVRMAFQSSRRARSKSKYSGN